MTTNKAHTSPQTHFVPPLTQRSFASTTTPKMSKKRKTVHSHSHQDPEQHQQQNNSKVRETNDMNIDEQEVNCDNLDPDVTMSSPSSFSSTTNTTNDNVNRRYDFKLCVYAMQDPSTFADLEFVIRDQKMTIIFFESIEKSLQASLYLNDIAPAGGRHKNNIISFNHLYLYPDLDDNAEQIMVICICHHPPLDVRQLMYIDRAVQYGCPEDIFTLACRIDQPDCQNGVFLVEPELDPEVVDRDVLEFATTQNMCRKTCLKTLLGRATAAR